MADMRLYLVQHGDALGKQIDPVRPLSEKGRSDIENLAKFLKGKIEVSLVMHSGKIRAQQSAEILAATLSRDARVEPFSALNPNDAPEKLLSWLEERQDDTLIVGHLPFLSKLVDRLLCGSASKDIVEFTPGTIVQIKTGQASSWQIGWMVCPELLRKS